jgi:WD40 repeat protein
MSDVFISYAKSDNTNGMIEQFINVLKKTKSPISVNKTIQVWFDEAGIRKGEHWEKEIAVGLEQAHTVALFISPRYFASMVCNQELEMALKLGKKLIPIWVDEVTSNAVEQEIDLRRAQSKETATFANAMQNYAVIRDRQAIRMDRDDTPQHERTLIELVNAIFENASLDDGATHWLQRMLIKERGKGGWLTGADLRAAESWLVEAQRVQTFVILPQTHDYICKSRKASHRRGLTRVMIILLTILVIALIGFFAIRQREARQQATILAATNEVIARENAIDAEAQRLLARANDVLSVPYGNAETATLLALQSFQLRDTPEARNVLARTLPLLQTEWILSLDDTIVESSASLQLLGGHKIVIVPDRNIAFVALGNQLVSIHLQTRQRLASQQLEGDIQALMVTENQLFVVTKNGASSYDFDLQISNVHVESNDVVGGCMLGQGDMFALAHQDGVVALYDSATPNTPIADYQHGNTTLQIVRLACIPKTNQFISLGPSGAELDDLQPKLKIWDANGLVDEIRIPLTVADNLDISADGNLIAVSGDGNRILIYNLSSYELVQTLTTSTSTITLPIRFSADSKSLLSLHSGIEAQDNHVGIVWDVATGEQMHILSGDLTLLLDGVFVNATQLMTLSIDGMLRYWNTNRPNNGISVVSDYQLGTRQIDFSADGTQFVTSSYIANTDNELRYIRYDYATIHSTATGLPIHTLIDPDGDVMGALFMPLHNYVLTYTLRDFDENRAHIRFWSAQTGEMVHHITTNVGKDVQEIRFSADGRYLLWREGRVKPNTFFASNPSGTLIVVDTTTWETIITLDNISDFEVANNAPIVMAKSARTVKIWDMDARQEVFTQDISLYNATLSPNGQWLVTNESSYEQATTLYITRVWDVATGAEVAVFDAVESVPKIEFDVNTVYRYYSLDINNYLQKWSADMTAIQTIPLQTQAEQRYLFISQNQLFTYESDDVNAFVNRWDMQTGIKLGNLPIGVTSFPEFLWSVFASVIDEDTMWQSAISKDGRYFVSGNASSEIATLWDIDSAQTAQILRQETTRQAPTVAYFSKDNTLVITVSFVLSEANIITPSLSGQIIQTHLWYVDLVQATCARLVRDLTPTERQQYGISTTNSSCISDDTQTTASPSEVNFPPLLPPSTPTLLPNEQYIADMFNLEIGDGRMIYESNTRYLSVDRDEDEINKWHFGEALFQGGTYFFDVLLSADIVHNGLACGFEVRYRRDNRVLVLISDTDIVKLVTDVNGSRRTQPILLDDIGETSNHLVVVALENRLLAFVNQILVLDVPLSTSDGPIGITGLYNNGGSESECEFRNVLFWELNPERIDSLQQKFDTLIP